LGGNLSYPHLLGKPLAREESIAEYSIFRMTPKITQRKKDAAGGSLASVKRLVYQLNAR
jgi:hypothetical protein